MFHNIVLYSQVNQPYVYTDPLFLEFPSHFRSPQLNSQLVKDLPVMQETPQFNFWVGKIPWRRAWQLTPAFLPGESHGRRSLAGYSPRGHKGSDMTERLNTAPRALRVPELCDGFSSLTYLHIAAVVCICQS